MRSKSRKPRFEPLESRQLLASDFDFIAKVEVVSATGSPVSQVNVGDTFKLRYTVIDGNPAKDSPVLLAGLNSDLSFDPNLVTPVGSIQFKQTMLDGYYEAPKAGRLTDIHYKRGLKTREYMMSNPGWVAPTLPSLQWEITMVANAPGVATINATQPFHSQWGVPYKDRPSVDWGYVRVNIGGASPSPWQNPGNPSDINGDGLVELGDFYLLEDFVAANGRVELTNSVIVQRQTPYLDLDGNRVVDSVDVERMKDHFSKDDLLLHPRFFHPDYKLTTSVVNLRTGVDGGQDARVGDILEVRVDKHFPMTFAKLRSSSKFEPMPSPVIDGLDTPNAFRIRVTAAGPIAIEYSFDQTWLRNVLLTHNEMDLDIYRSRVEELIPSLRREVVAQPAAQRPVAMPDTFRYDKLVGVKSAKEAALLASDPANTTIAPAAANGVLSNDQATANRKAILIEGFYDVQFQSDGSFVFPSKYWNRPSQIRYVVADDNGTSEIQTVTIEPVTLPIADVSIYYVDASGKRIDRVRVGEEFSLRAAVFTNNEIMLRTTYDVVTDPELASTPFVASTINHLITPPLKFTYNVDASLADTIVPPVPNIAFANFTAESTVESNGKMQSSSRMHVPSFTEGPNGYHVDLVRYSAMAPRDAEIVALEHVLKAAQPGKLRTTVADPFVIDLSIADDAKNKLPLNVILADLEIFEELHNFLLPNDVDDDNQVTPLDVLTLVNHINQTATTESVDAYYVDVDDDGGLTPLDVLRVVNHLNATSAEGEGAITRMECEKSSAEASIEYGETLKFKIRDAKPSAEIPVTLGGKILGKVKTDDRGRGTLEVNCNESIHSQIDSGAIVAIGDTMHGKVNGATSKSTTNKNQLDTTKIGNASEIDAFFVDFDDDDQLTILDTLTIVNGFDPPTLSEQPIPYSDGYERYLAASVEFNPSAASSNITIRVRNGVSGTQYPVTLGGRSVGTITTNASGRGDLTVSIDASMRTMLQQKETSITIGESIRGTLFPSEPNSQLIRWQSAFYKVDGSLALVEYQTDKLGSSSNSQTLERLRLQLDGVRANWSFDIHKSAFSVWSMGRVKSDATGSIRHEWTSKYDVSLIQPNSHKSWFESGQLLRGSKLLKISPRSSANRFESIR